MTHVDGVQKYWYDENGNMITRIVTDTYQFTYDTENRITAVSGGTEVTFVYDGDGNMVKKIAAEVTTVYVADHYEYVISGTETITRAYYHAAGQRVATRENGTLYYLLTDHLGSTSITTDASGVKIAELRYKPWGEVRYAWGSQVTDYTYTGQRSEVGSFGLMYYRARWYDPVLGRFAQADTIVPNPGDVLSWERYSYVQNNPLKYTDPSGHVLCSPNRPNCEEEYQLTSPDPQQSSPIPPITYDNNNGLCINAGNIGCSGTVESNLEWINWNVSMLPYEAERRYSSAEWWNDISVVLTDAAFATSSAGATVEAAFTAAGATGGPFGGLVGAVLGNMVHQVILNPIETALSFGSLGATLRADSLSGDSRVSMDLNNNTVKVNIGEASATALTTQIVGGVIPIGVFDAMIDGYAAAYAHGITDGILRRLGIGGRILNLGLISIQFGE